MARAQITEKSFECRRKSSPDRPKIDEKSFLSHFGRPRPYRGRVRTCLGHFLNAQMPPQSRSWGALGKPRVAKSRPKASPGRTRDAPRASGTAPKTLGTLFASPTSVGSACGSVFDRFSVNARRLRSTFRVGFCSVFSMSDVLRVER